MKFPLFAALFLLFAASSLQGQEMQSVIRFDSCASMPLTATVFTEAEVRPTEAARWNQAKQSLENYLKPPVRRPFGQAVINLKQGNAPVRQRPLLENLHGAQITSHRGHASA